MFQNIILFSLIITAYSDSNKYIYTQSTLSTQITSPQNYIIKTIQTPLQKIQFIQNPIWIWAQEQFSYILAEQFIIQDIFSLTFISNNQIKILISSNTNYELLLNGNTFQKKDSQNDDENNYKDLYKYSIKDQICGSLLNLTITSHKSGKQNPAIFYAIYSQNSYQCQQKKFYSPQNCQCLKCSDFDHNCEKCSENNKCESCLQGYQLNSNYVCQQCTSNLIGCLCQSNNQCQLCNQVEKFTFSQNKCICKQSYFLSQNKCLSCNNLVLGCDSCSTQKICNSCINNLKLRNGICDCQQSNYILEQKSLQCKKCSQKIQNCQICNSESSCKKCKSKYFLNNLNKCQNCRSKNQGCEQCQSQIICSSCIQSFYMTQYNICQFCNKSISGCKICSQSLNCQKCSQQYGFHLQKIQKKNICLCNNGFTIFNQKCSKCSQLIIGCDQCVNSEICIKCSREYALDNNLCYPCKNYLNGCKFCLSTKICKQCNSQNNHMRKSKCQCNNGLILKNEQNCERCQSSIPGCINCHSQKYCLNCNVSGYFKQNTNKLCSCMNGFYFQNNQCNFCNKTILGCNQCASKNHCLVCNQNKKFQLNQNYKCICATGLYLRNTQCFNCNDTIIGCLSCTNNLNCLSCNLIYNFQLSSTKNCLCKYGFFLDFNFCKQCSKYLLGCSNCKSFLNCIQCSSVNNFQLKDNKCKCKTGFILINQTCISCDRYLPGCINCLSITQCLDCNSNKNFIKDNNNCICQNNFKKYLGCNLCQTNQKQKCSICNHIGHFIQSDSGCKCELGYFLINQYCQLCDQNCLSCTFTKNNCKNCKQGYFLNQLNQCQPCMAGCLNCQQFYKCKICNTSSHHQLKLTSCGCMQNYLTFGTSCVSCSKILDGCLNCNTILKCYSCSNEFSSAKSCCNQISVCTSCDVNNLFYLSNGTCKCQAGYYVTGDSDLKKCQMCNQNCLSCSNNDKNCTSCMVGMFLNNSVCQVCQIGCASCLNLDFCFNCNTRQNYELSDNICICKYLYVLSNSLCQLCTNLITGCLSCNNQVQCNVCDESKFFSLTALNSCQCIQSYYQINQFQFAYCLKCDNNCLTCSTQSYNCQTCIIGLFLNQNNFCQSCSIGCLSCKSLTQCDLCDQSHNFIIQSGICNCQLEYILNNNICQLCTKFMEGCNICTSQNTCKQCETNNRFYLNQNYFCHKCDPNCLTCFQQSKNCTSCFNKNQFINQNRQCQTCKYGCLQCDSLSKCLKCDTLSLFLLNQSNCICFTGYYLSKQKCQKCQIPCITCSSNSQCSSCISGYYLELNFCKICPVGCSSCLNQNKCIICDKGFNLSNDICICNNGTYLDTNSFICQKCDLTCLTCNQNGKNHCLKCNFSLFRYLKQNTCVCIENYYKQSITTYPTCELTTFGVCMKDFYWNIQKQACLQICGDGHLYFYECDDGNTDDGDGCSSKCSLEEDYVCVNGTQTTKSVCGFTGVFELVILSQTKKITSNNLQFQISILPYFDTLNSLDNLFDFIKLNLKDSQIISAYFSNGILYLDISYNSTIQKLSGNIIFQGPINYKNLFAFQTSSINFIINPTNNQAAVYYNDSIYSSVNITLKALNVVQATSLGSLGVGLFFSKIISLQMINIMQSSYNQLSVVDSMNPVQSTITTLQYVNGYNNLSINFLDDNPNNLVNRRNLQFINGSISLPSRVTAIRMKHHFIQNFNYMYFALIGIFLIGIILRLIGNRLKKKKKILRISRFILKQLMLIVLFFNVNNMGLSFGIHCRYLFFNQIWRTSLIVSWLIALSSVIFLSIYLSYFIYKLKDFGEFNQKFKKDKISQMHSPIFMILRYIIGFCSGYFNQYSQICYGIVGAQVIFLLYISIKKPYQMPVQNIRASINEFILLCIAIANMYYRIFVNNSFIVQNMTYVSPAYVQLALIGFAVVMNTILLLYYFYIKYCKKQSEAKIYPNNQQLKSNQKLNENLEMDNISKIEFANKGDEQFIYRSQKQDIINIDLAIQDENKAKNQLDIAKSKNQKIQIVGVEKKKWKKQVKKNRKVRQKKTKRQENQPQIQISQIDDSVNLD